MNDTPPEGPNHREELIVDLRLLHSIPSFNLLLLVLRVELNAGVFEFKQWAALPEDVAELIHIFLVFAGTTHG